MRHVAGMTNVIEEKIDTPPFSMLGWKKLYSTSRGLNMSKHGHGKEGEIPSVSSRGFIFWLFVPFLVFTPVLLEGCSGGSGTPGIDTIDPTGGVGGGGSSGDGGSGGEDATSYREGCLDSWAGKGLHCKSDILIGTEIVEGQPADEACCVVVDMETFTFIAPDVGYLLVKVEDDGSKSLGGCLEEKSMVESLLTPGDGIVECTR